MISDSHLRFYRENGYVVIESVFSAEEVAALRDHFMTLRQTPHPGDDVGITLDSADPLKRYPRMIHPHKWDEAARRYLFDPRVNACLTALLGREPFAAQTMIYFKPPGARGQALHQDNYYLRAKPGTCMAAWMALDVCDEANGCLQVVPGSHTWDILCTEAADTTVSFTDVTVPLPPGQQAQPVLMQPGDILFFNGSIVHGSLPNTTTDRLRRALIAHYVEGDSTHVSKGYHPVWRMDGTQVTVEHNPGSDRCGLWVEQGGAVHLELAGVQTTVHRQHDQPH